MSVDKLIARINELAKKSRTEGLTPEEKEEQHTLRMEYVALYRRNLEETLNNTVIQEPDGTRHPLMRKPPKESSLS
jgi:uncharacterized protein YnzC (UPF0291/DUF896 family)